MNREKIAVSGINGFVGNHLTKELASQNIDIVGIGQEPTPNEDIRDTVGQYFQADLTQEWPEIQDVKAVIHLAGLAAVGPSFDNPQKYINLNSAMVTNLCEYYLKQEKKPRIILVSSGAIYSPEQPMPIAENGEIGYSSPYAVSKVLNENQARYYRNRGLDCIIVRPFNHIGPGQAGGFILPDLYERLSKLSSDEHVLTTGNIETRRDYTDVRDIVKAYGKLAVAESLKHSVYNLCSGKSTSGAEILAILKRVMGRDNVHYQIDPLLARPNDTIDIFGDCSRLANELDWSAEINIEQTIADYVKSKAL